MPVLPINIKEEGRERLGVALLLLNMLAVLVGAIIILFGMYIEYYVDSELSILVDYTPDPIGKILYACGGIAIVTHLITAKIGYDSGYFKTRQRFQVFLVMNVLFVGGISVVMMVLAVIVFLMQFYTDYQLEDSFKASMLEYKVNKLINMQGIYLPSGDVIVIIPCIFIWGTINYR